jgi:hypothetical protein
MSPSPDLVALYNRSIILWVEDLVTSTYLEECWRDPAIGFRIAGGVDGVRVAARSALEAGFRHVFGFVDRDFTTSNRTGWNNSASSPVLIPEVHEVENYLLESAHLAGCDLNNGRRIAADVEARLQACAGGMVWWMACRQVLSDLRAEFLMDFPPHSRVIDLASSERHICGSGWYQRLRDYNRTVIPASEITRRLNDAHVIATGEHASGQWRRSFSGKDLLHELHHWLYTPPPSGAIAATEVDRDLARSVARWQVANSAVPAEVVELRAAMRHRVGI